MGDGFPQVGLIAISQGVGVVEGLCQTVLRFSPLYGKGGVRVDLQCVLIVANGLLKNRLLAFFLLSKVSISETKLCSGRLLGEVFSGVYPKSVLIEGNR